MLRKRAADALTGRRGLLRRALLGVGGAAGLSVVGTSSASADPGAADAGDFSVLTVGETLTVGQAAGPQLLFSSTGAGVTLTGSPSRVEGVVDTALRVESPAAAGIVVTSGGTGIVVGNPGGVAAEFSGTTSMTTGTSNSTVLTVDSVGTIDAVAVQAAAGRGLVVASETGCQLNLRPGAGGTHPQTGQPGDFYLDAHVRLWLCKGGRMWRQVA